MAIYWPYIIHQSPHHFNLCRLIWFTGTLSTSTRSSRSRSRSGSKSDNSKSSGKTTRAATATSRRSGSGSGTGTYRNTPRSKHDRWTMEVTDCPASPGTYIKKYGYISISLYPYISISLHLYISLSLYCIHLSWSVLCYALESQPLSSYLLLSHISYSSTSIAHNHHSITLTSLNP